MKLLHNTVLALALLTCCILSSTASATSLSGYVVSAGTDIPYGGTVFALPGMQSTIIAADGSYRFEDIPAGTLSIAIVHPGFHFYSTSFKVEDGENQRNLVLIADKFNGDEDFVSKLNELERVIYACRLRDGLHGNTLASTSANTTPGAALAPGVRSKSAIPAAPTEHKSASAQLASSSMTFESAINNSAQNNNDNHSENTVLSADESSHSDVLARVTVYPNPSDEHAVVSFHLATEARVVMELFNTQSGTRITVEELGLRSSGDNTMRLNLSQLAAGSYTVLLRTSTCQYSIANFVKN